MSGAKTKKTGLPKQIDSSSSSDSEKNYAKTQKKPSDGSQVSEKSQELDTLDGSDKTMENTIDNLVEEYIHKRTRNLLKRKQKLDKYESIIKENPSNHNLKPDQLASLENKDQVIFPLKELDEISRVFTSYKSSLEEKHNNEIKLINKKLNKEELINKDLTEKVDFYKNTVKTLVQFLRLASIRRQIAAVNTNNNTNNDKTINEDQAIETLLSAVYLGDDSSVRAAELLSKADSTEIISNNLTYADIFNLIQDSDAYDSNSTFDFDDKNVHFDDDVDVDVDENTTENQLISEEPVEAIVASQENGNDSDSALVGFKVNNSDSSLSSNSNSLNSDNVVVSGRFNDSNLEVHGIQFLNKSELDYGTNNKLDSNSQPDTSIANSITLETTGDGNLAAQVDAGEKPPAQTIIDNSANFSAISKENSDLIQNSTNSYNRSHHYYRPRRGNNMSNFRRSPVNGNQDADSSSSYPRPRPQKRIWNNPNNSNDNNNNSNYSFRNGRNNYRGNGLRGGRRQPGADSFSTEKRFSKNSNNTNNNNNNNHNNHNNNNNQIAVGIA